MSSSPVQTTVSDIFQNSNRSQINVAIVGAVSAGKSTLLNTIFAKTYSHCKIKRTTMTPQIYYEFDGKAPSKTSNAIRDENKLINDQMIKKTEANEKVTIEDIKEAKYIVPKMYKFTELVKEVYLTVYDIPGLNDARTKDLYFQYIETNFFKFDIILFVVDINSALNTSDEIEILTKIVSNCKRNFDQFGVHNKLIVMANKCDEMTLDKAGNLQLDEELYEMFEQITTQVSQTVNTIFPQLEYDIIPLSSEDSYIYRILEQNPDTELDMKYLNKFGYMEFGRTRWNKLSEEKKKAQIKKLMSEWDMESTLHITGFNGFRTTLNKFLSIENQKIFVNNHIIYELKQITMNTKVDINDEVLKFFKYYKKYQDLNKRIKGGINVIEIFVDHMTAFLKGYVNNVLTGFIDGINSTDMGMLVGKKPAAKDASEGKIPTSPKIKNESYVPQVEEVKKIMDSMVSTFGGDVPIIGVISNSINETLTQFYTQEIDSKSKPVKTLYNYIMSLLGFNVKLSSNNIDNFFDNPNMLNSSAENIISYLKKFESEHLLDSETKLNKVLDILIKIYRNISDMVKEHEPTTEYMKCEDYPSYSYYVDKFWTKFIMFNDDYDDRIEELAFISKINVTHRIGHNKFNKQFNQDKATLLTLENYFSDIYDEYISERMNVPPVLMQTSTPNPTSTRGCSVTSPVIRFSYKREGINNTDGDNDDLGGDIDKALGLVC
jgi:predicted GTPase